MAIAEFKRATARAQVARLRPLALRALAEHGIRHERVKLLFHGENTTFRADGPDGRFVVRVHRAGYQSTDAIRSELFFLAALKKAGSIRASVPHATASGEYLLRLDGANLDADRDVSVLHWTDGRHVADRSKGTFRKLGALTACLHNFAADWHLPPAFERSSGRIRDQLAGAPTVARLEDVPELSDALRAELCEARAASIAWADPLEERDGIFPVHTDLHFGNVIIQSGELCPIDFDDLAIAHPLADVAVSVAVAKPEFRAAYIAGYKLHREFPDAWVAAIPAFIAARQLLMVGWVSSRAAELPRLRKWVPYSIARAEHGAKWLQSGDETWMEKFRELPVPKDD